MQKHLYKCYAIEQGVGTMPEELPTPKKSLKELKKDKKRLQGSENTELAKSK